MRSRAARALLRSVCGEGLGLGPVRLGAGGAMAWMRAQSRRGTDLLGEAARRKGKSEPTGLAEGARFLFADCQDRLGWEGATATGRAKK